MHAIKKARRLIAGQSTHAHAQTLARLLMACVFAGAAPAMATEKPGVVAGDSAACVEVEVNGERAPSFPCLTQKLLPPAQKPAGPPARGLASEEITQRPSQQLGLFNRAATEHRMGNTFGNSVRPQRPLAYTPASPMIPRLDPAR